MNNKIAIVTGVGRLAGIGYAVCEELARRGIDICFTYWSAYDDSMPWEVGAQETEEIKRRLLEKGIRCTAIELDLSREESVAHLLDHTFQSLGPPHILINNATYSTQTGVDDLTFAELDRHYRVNLRATTMLTLEFVRRFPSGRHGSIVNLTSGQSLGPMSAEIAYAVTKGAVETLTYTLAPEIAARGLTINAVNPGPTDTGWMDETLQAALLSRFPPGKIGEPADAARLIGFLTSEEARWVTGQVIHSEGGFRR